MSGAGITIDVALEDVATQAVLKQLLAISGDLTEVMDKIGGHVLFTTQVRFAEGRGPAGVPWKPSRRALFEGGKTMIKKGRLMQGITQNPTATDVTVGAKEVYAAIHQFGGEIKHPGGTKFIRDAAIGKGKKARLGTRFVNNSFAGETETTGAHIISMPARPFLGIDAADETEILAIVQSHIANILGGAAA